MSDNNPSLPFVYDDYASLYPAVVSNLSIYDITFQAQDDGAPMEIVFTLKNGVEGNFF